MDSGDFLVGLQVLGTEWIFNPLLRLTPAASPTALQTIAIHISPFLLPLVCDGSVELPFPSKLSEM